MFKKKIKISAGFLVAILLYSVIISVLYFRMKYAERRLADYNDRLCPSSSDCRELRKAEILDYGSSKVSFTNYGPKGMPLESGSFVEYIFVISLNDSEITSVKVLPNTPSNVSGFDMVNIYIPSKRDSNLISGSFFDGKSVYVETWRGKITFLFVNSAPVPSVQSGETQIIDEKISIGPSSSLVYETVLPTENHPLILAESAINDFRGWTIVLLIAVVAYFVFGGVVIGFIYSMDWVVNKWRKNE